MIRRIADELKEGKQIPVLAMNITTNFDWGLDFKQYGLGTDTDPAKKTEGLNLLLSERKLSIRIFKFEVVHPGNNRIDINRVVMLAAFHDWRIVRREISIKFDRI